MAGGDRAEMVRSFARSLGLAAVGVAALLVALLAAYGRTVGSGAAQAIAVGVVSAAAALTVASVLGFLFGVPRSGTEGAGTAAGSAAPGILPNTNLEQISDWLTKLLVGASLTQIGRIRDTYVGLSRSVGDGLGGPAGTQLAGGLLLLFAALGFLAGWLATRLLLGRAMAEADHWATAQRFLERADEASAAGETADAVALTKMAADVLTGVTVESANYASLRSKPAGSTRTRAMEALMRRASQHAKEAGNSLTRDQTEQLFRSGDPGSRIQAIAFMSARDDLVDASLLAEAIRKPVSAFEQYHALVAARDSAGVWHDDQAATAQIRDAVTAAMATPEVQRSRDRTGVASALLARLDAKTR